MGLREARRLTPARRGDFAAIHAGESGWCQCVAWWVETWEGWGARSAGENEALRADLFARGEDDGYLLYDELERPLAWAQVGPRDRLLKLTRSFELAPDPEAWAITCLQVPLSERRRGHARALVRAILADLPARGARRVEAFPRCGPKLGDDELWTGPERLYRELGFLPVTPAGAGPQRAFQATGERRIFRKELG